MARGPLHLRCFQTAFKPHSNCRWDESEIDRRLDRYMTDAYHEINALTKDTKNTSLRAAAYQLAVKRVVQAETNRGFD